MNPLADFVEDECVLGDGLSVIGGDLYKAYREYAETNGNKYPVGRKRFTALLAEMGIQGGRAATKRGDRTYTGIALRSSDTSDTSLLEESPNKTSMGTFSESNLSERQNEGEGSTEVELKIKSLDELTFNGPAMELDLSQDPWSDEQDEE